MFAATDVHQDCAFRQLSQTVAIKNITRLVCQRQDVNQELACGQERGKLRLPMKALDTRQRFGAARPTLHWIIQRA